MKSFRNIAITITLAAMLSACAQITLVKPGVTTVNDTLTLNTLEPWNKFPPIMAWKSGLSTVPVSKPSDSIPRLKRARTLHVRKVLIVGQTPSTRTCRPSRRV